MSNLQRPNSLDDPAIATQPAPMVRQAIALTSLVGQRYLWVDTLCIDHSRIAESTTQLQNMGAIYANASLTIVALDRDAEDGFPGLRDISREKDRDDEVPIQFGNEQFILDKLSYFGLTSWTAASPGGSFVVFLKCFSKPHLAGNLPGITPTSDDEYIPTASIQADYIHAFFHPGRESGGKDWLILEA
ncbi:hypothetical protein CGCSCA4_v001849 [Colletotrichum siamense]|uniref:Heterokaryon incompatibility domain-containing protein n=1 Tax=Colletotrichum siamense TaxID=690259 RepID=A0A9P5F0D6_COLSI|nr:hypothetical protein CGCSCA4_v001849 [Colletotrichum siamense]KAF4864454.1 hypothetical protein CGCSCA2_v001985 [Colletotrichum siamense]